jgi:predicted ATPase
MIILPPPARRRPRQRNHNRRARKRNNGVLTMLKKITLRNFKSFRDNTFELGPLTLMVGANASGKSNFVDALRFLQGCARGLKVSEIFVGKWEGGQQIWFPIRGGAQEAFNLFEYANSFEVEVQCEFAGVDSKNVSIYRIGVKRTNEVLSIHNERMFVADEEYIHPILKGFDVIDTSILLSPLILAAFSSNIPTTVQHWVPIIRKWLSDFHFFDLAPSLMRDYVPQNLPEIGARGENLSAVLFKIASNPDQRRTVLGWIQELCPQEITDFDFVETKLGDVLLAAKEPNGVTVSARSMSDGTLRFLAIIVAMLTAKEGTTFVIEEIDNDLHPSRLHLLVNFLEQVATSRKLQVIASTHSPYFLDYLSEESLKHVLVFHREAQTAETKVTKLVDIPGFAEARKNMPLDFMHASSWMEQNL